MKKFAFQLPMLASHQLRPQIRPISSNKVRIFLGNTFYMRLSSIYRNIVTAIAQDDWKYLAAALDSELYEQLTEEITKIKSNNFKIRMIQGKATPVILGKKRKRFQIRQNEWNDEWTKIALECQVAFGQNYASKVVAKTPKAEKSGSKQPLKQQTKKIFRIGPYRKIVYRPGIGLIDNFRRIYNDQSFQFRVRVKSRLRLQITGKQGEIVSGDQDQGPEKEVITQMRLKSGNQTFNWLITSINGLGRSQL